MLRWRRMNIDRAVGRLLQMTAFENDAVDVGNNQVVIGPLDFSDDISFRFEIAHFPEQHREIVEIL